MPADLAVRRLPAAQRLGLRVQARGEPEIVQQAVVGNGHQVAAIAFACLQERTIEQLHLAQRERLLAQLHGRLPFRGRCYLRRRCGQRLAVRQQAQRRQRGAAVVQEIAPCAGQARIVMFRHASAPASGVRRVNNRCSRQNTSSSAPITMRVHHELSVPSNTIRVWITPRISTPNSVPIT